MSTPRQIVENARPGDTVVGWKLAAGDRTKLLQRFQPKYSETVADHITLAAKVASDTPLPADTEGMIAGHVDDGSGVEALVVRIGGSSDRPGGGTFHITWSLAKGRRPQESNDVLAKQDWLALEPIPIRFTGARIR